VNELDGSTTATTPIGFTVDRETIQKILQPQLDAPHDTVRANVGAVLKGTTVLDGVAMDVAPPRCPPSRPSREKTWTSVAFFD
jgi:hypothetical protein